ncbi:MAG: sigma-54-dependent Fis family transcriptional regulator [Nitrospirae bacterium]|nr:sigma-54-dependent Fis family transcriptional regulator [Nitrospirota bacterium]
MTEKILAVDDEPDMLKLLSMIIKDKTPYEIVTTNNPLEALELAKQGGFDVVVADLKMPGLDGVELLEAIRGINEDTPVIIITAYSSAESATEAMQKGAFDFITKPFRKEQILYTIDRALKWVKLQNENRMLKERFKKVEG